MTVPDDVYSATYIAADRYSITLRLAYEMLDHIDLGDEDCLLVPCVGHGAMLEPVLTGLVPTPRVIVGVEKNAEEAEYINRHLVGASAMGVIAVAGDFLEMGNPFRPTAIAIAPPLSNHQAIAHIRHAYGMLSPGGRMISVCAARDLYAGDAGCADFRSFLEEENASVLRVRPHSLPSCDLPARLISLTKPQRH